MGFAGPRNPLRTVVPLVTLALALQQPQRTQSYIKEKQTAGLTIASVTFERSAKSPHAAN